MLGASRLRKGPLKMPKESDGYVRAIERGFALVEALGRSPGRHTLSEAADHAGLNRATARRMLATLVTLKYCEADGRYFRLRPRALGLGLSYLNALPFWGYAQRALEDLRNEIGESCALAVLDETEIVYALRLPARRILSANLGIGSRLPAFPVVAPRSRHRRFQSEANCVLCGLLLRRSGLDSGLVGDGNRRRAG